jgi:DNA-directed RNA polymerase subunit RPC12/RpoP
MRWGDLQCPNGCTVGRFEALNAPVHVDRARRYLDHDDSRATFVCVQCQAVAVDLGEVSRAMRAEGEASTVILVCPNCGTEMLPPIDDTMSAYVECPACEVRFAIEEGMPRLHGTSLDPEDLI